VADAATLTARPGLRLPTARLGAALGPGVSLLYLCLIVALPVAALVQRAATPHFWAAITSPQAKSALELTLLMAVLAAAHDSDRIDAFAADMVHVHETIEPSPTSAGRYDEAYLRLVGELGSRGWLQPVAAAHARERTRR